MRGIRGATTATENTRDAILDATRELLDAMIRANDLRADDIASAIFTMTGDLDAAGPDPEKTTAQDAPGRAISTRPLSLYGRKTGSE